MGDDGQVDGCGRDQGGAVSDGGEFFLTGYTGVGGGEDWVWRLDWSSWGS